MASKQPGTRKASSAPLPKDERRASWIASGVFLASGIALLAMFNNPLEIILYAVAALLFLVGLVMIVVFAIQRKGKRMIGTAAAGVVLGGGMAVHDFTPVGLAIHLAVAGLCIVLAMVQAILALRR